MDCKHPKTITLNDGRVYCKIGKCSKELVVLEKTQHDKMQDVIEKIRAAWKGTEGYSQGTKIANCVPHISLDITERPTDCDLCHTDMGNFINRATAVNAFLNKQFDIVLDSLNELEALGDEREMPESEVEDWTIAEDITGDTPLEY